MSAIKVFEQELNGSSAQVTVEMKTFSFSVTLIVDGDLVERRTGFRIALSIPGKVYNGVCLVLEGRGFEAKVWVDQVEGTFSRLIKGSPRKFYFSPGTVSCEWAHAINVD